MTWPARCERDPVHPAIEPVADDLTRPTRILPTELLGAGLLDIAIVDLIDAENDELLDRRFVMQIRLRWRGDRSPLARAARAAGAYLQAAGVDLATVTLMPRGALDDGKSRLAVDCRETHLRDLIVYLGYNGIADGLFVLHPQRRRPMRALRLTVPDPAALPISDVEGWLSQRAADSPDRVITRRGSVSSEARAKHWGS
jgi:hypothetical protein